MLPEIFQTPVKCPRCLNTTSWIKVFIKQTRNCSACGYAWPYLELQFILGGALVLITPGVLDALGVLPWLKYLIPWYGYL